MPTREETANLIRRLSAIPARLTSALMSLQDADSVDSSQPGQWTSAEVLAHVRASNDILEPRIYQVLVRDNPALLAFDEQKWAQIAGYTSVPLLESLAALSFRRADLVRLLQSLSPGDWDRTGTHETNGPMTVWQLANYIADHDAEHAAQIEAVVGS